MHPVLGNIRRLGVYLFVWWLLAELLFLPPSTRGGMTRLQAAAIMMPLFLIYAFVCLSAWYSCRAMPLAKTRFGNLLLSHGLAALVATFFWIALGTALARVLAQYATFAGIKEEFAKSFPLLFSVGVLLYLLNVIFFYLLLAQEASREAEQQAIQAQVLAREAELRALKAQVNPHFLFNSLHSISALTSSDPAKAREMCIALADFLRRTLGLGEKNVISLEEELSLIHSFLAVEKIRFGARIDLQENVDPETLTCLVPPLLLQPLVENAIAHGIASLTEGGWIRLNAEHRSEDGSVAIEVANNFDIEAPARRRSGVGLVNVRQRLEARYGDKASFSVEKEDDSFFVKLTLPAESKAVPA